MKQLNSKGSSPLHIVLILVIVGLVAGVGYYVYNAQKKTNTALDNAASSQAEPQKSEKKEESKSNANTGYLVIKEWGVKIPLSSEDAGVYYEVSNVEQSKSDPSSLTIYSKETDAITGASGVNCKGEYVAYLLRLPSSDTKWEPSQNVDDGNVSPLYGSRTDIGNYRYAIATKKSYGPTCLATSSTGDYKTDEVAAQRFQKVTDAFSNDFKKIQSN